MTVGVVGLGLIGGSIGLALRDPSRRIIGYDPSPEARQIATDRGCIDEFVDLGAVSLADLVFVAVPPSALAAVLSAIAALRGPNTVVTDVTSVKAEAVAWATEQKATYFVPGHPMAGHEKGSAQYASAWMFRNAKWILCPLAKTDRKAVRLVEDMVKEMGGQPVRVSADDHDRSVALYSHLPHALAGALLRMASGLGGEPVGGGSWADLTRVGGVDPDLWTQIFMGNRTQIAACLGDLARDLNALEESLSSADREAVREFFVRAKEAKPK